MEEEEEEEEEKEEEEEEEEDNYRFSLRNCIQSQTFLNKAINSFLYMTQANAGRPKS